MSEAIDLGGGFRFTPRYVEGELYGFVFDHPRPDGTPCAPDNWIPVRHRWWTLHSLDPLTLSPSLHCKLCGRHGFVREGKWVEA